MAELRRADYARMRARRIAVAAGFLLAAGVLAGGCGGGSRHASPLPPETTAVQPPPVPQETNAKPKTSRSRKEAPPASHVEPKTAPPPPTRSVPQEAPITCPGGTVHAVGDNGVTYAAIARRPTAARRTPNGELLSTFGLTNSNGYATTFQIRGLVRDGCGRLWYYAALPMRPNGIAGFVPARDVSVEKVRTRIVVDLSDRRLTFYRDAQPVLASPVAIGAPATPTPTGRYYVNQRLIPSDPSGPYGPAALGISAFSDVLQGWTQGGPIGIHGTNDPGSIGRAVSHGCVRLPNSVLRRVFAAAPGGTPVVIRA